MRKLAVILTLLWGSLCLVGAQDAQNDSAAGGIAVTVYNQGTALIRDQRSLSLEAGLNVIDFRDVAASIDPTSVSFQSLSDPDGTVVLEQNYIYDLVDSQALLTRYLDETINITAADGTVYTGELLSGRNGQAILRMPDGEVAIVNLNDARDIRFPTLPEALITRPTLQWLLHSAGAGEQDVELTYLAGGMNWTADYNLLLAVDESHLDLKGWVTLNNHSGRAFSDARLKLVAGDINRIQQPEPVFAQSREMAFDEGIGGGGGVEQRSLFEYQLYEVQRSVTIKDSETKQIEFVSAADIAASSFFVFDNSPQFSDYYAPVDYAAGYSTPDSRDVLTFLEFNTGDESGLGADLPAGRIRVYQQDVDGAGLLIGENRIDHTPEGEDVQIMLGKAFDLVGERTQSDYTVISRDVVQESFEIRLRNRKEDEAVVIRVPERLYRWSDWEIIDSSAPYERINSTTIEFRIDVEPGAEAVLTYTVQYTFPRLR